MNKTDQVPTLGDLERDRHKQTQNLWEVLSAVEENMYVEGDAEGAQEERCHCIWRQAPRALW